MNTRLKIICILFGVAYLFIIGEFIINEAISSFKAGLSDEEPEVKNINTEDDSSGVDSSTDLFDSFYFYVKPKAGKNSYPTSMLNKKTEELVQAEAEILSVKIRKQEVKIPTWLVVARVFQIISAFVIFFFLIYIPILVYKVIRSIIQNKIFDNIIVKRIRRIGYSILITFGSLVYFSSVSTIGAKILIDLEDYKIVFSLNEEYSLLLMGLMTLLFAEILKISHTIKEENDLTI
jgi:hypothetical protein